MRNKILNRNLYPITFWLIISNIILFIVGTITPLTLFVSPPIGIVTSIFINHGFFNILFSSLMLWYFGPRVEFKFGSPKFLMFYIGIGIIINILMLMFGSVHIGNGGIIFCLFVIYALENPENKISLFGIKPLTFKVKHIVIGMLVIDLFCILTSCGVGSYADFIGAGLGWLTYNLYINKGNKYRGNRKNERDNMKSYMNYRYGNKKRRF